MQRIFMPALLISLLLCLYVTNPRHAQAQTFADFPVKVELTVPLPPTPVKAHGKLHLLYELHMTNFSEERLVLTRLEILGDAMDAPPLTSYQDGELEERMMRPGLWPAVVDSRVISPGLWAVIFLQLVVEPTGLPTALRHRLFLTSTDPGGKVSQRIVESERSVVHRTAPLVIAAPLRGAGWLAIGGMSNTSGHRRELMQGHGRMQIAQRFAIDWIKIADDGQVFHDDPLQNTNWYGYGQAVLAVADGVVVAVKDGIPENVPLSGEFSVPITAETLSGNYVFLDLGNHHFALYGHLQPKSLRVNVGDKVRRGQVLGLLGNSGNSDAPHLHFHITNAGSPLGAEGIPYVFQAFDLQGMVASLDVFESGAGWTPEGNAQQHQREIPLEYSIVRFP